MRGLGILFVIWLSAFPAGAVPEPAASAVGFLERETTCTIGVVLAGGCPLWTRDGPAASYTSIGVKDLALSPDGTKLYALGSGAGPDLVLMAVDRPTGGVLWSTRVADATPSGQAYDERAWDLAISHDGTRLYAGASRSFIYSYSLVVAFDAADGSRLWTVARSNDGYSDYGNKAVAVSSDDSTVFATGRARIYSSGAYAIAQRTLAINAGDGSITWEANYSSASVDTLWHSQPMGLAASGDGSRLLVGGSFTLAYHTSNGTLIWATDMDLNGPVQGHSLMLDEAAERVYLVGVGKTGQYPNTKGAAVAKAVDLDDGSVIWSRRWDNVFPGGAALSPDGLFLAADDGVHALDPSTGADRWTARLVGSEPFAFEVGWQGLPVASDSARVYVAGNREVAALDAVTGATIFHSTDAAYSPQVLALDGGSVYVGGTDGAGSTVQLRIAAISRDEGAAAQM